MMRVAERPLAQEPAVAEAARDLLDHAQLERLGRFERRQDPGHRAASIDLPAPGGPIINRLWPPAAAISSARLALSWPFTSLKSRLAARGCASFGSGGGRSCVPLKWLTIARRLGAAMISTSPAQAASLPHSAG